MLRRMIFAVACLFFLNVACAVLTPPSASTPAATRSNESNDVKTPVMNRPTHAMTKSKTPRVMTNTPVSKTTTPTTTLTPPVKSTQTPSKLPAENAAPTETQEPTVSPSPVFEITALPSETPLPTISSTPGPGKLLFRLEQAVFSEVLLSANARHLGVRMGDDAIGKIWDVQTGQSWNLALESFEHVFRLGSVDTSALIAVYLPAQSDKLSLWQVSPESGFPLRVFDLYQVDRAFWMRLGDAEPTLSFPLSENQTELWVTDVAFSPDGKTFAVGYSAGELCLFNTSDGKLIWKVAAHSDWISPLVFSPDGRFLYTDSFSFDPNTYVWDAKTGQKLATLSKESYEPFSGFFSVSSDMVAMQTLDGTRVFKTSDWKTLGLIPAPIYGLLPTKKGLPPQIPLKHFDLDKGETVFAYDPSYVFLPDGRILWLEVNEETGAIRLYQIAP